VVVPPGWSAAERRRPIGPGRQARRGPRPGGCGAPTSNRIPRPEARACEAERPRLREADGRLRHSRRRRVGATPLLPHHDLTGRRARRRSTGRCQQASLRAQSRIRSRSSWSRDAAICSANSLSCSWIPRQETQLWIKEVRVDGRRYFVCGNESGKGCCRSARHRPQPRSMRWPVLFASIVSSLASSESPGRTGLRG
jgi:hypothetical protein